jgi:hypothetical protein
VRDASGGAASAPDLVTLDFARTFDIHIDGAAPVTGDAGGMPCSLSIEMTTSVTITASDIRSNPNAACPNPD